MSKDFRNTSNLAKNWFEKKGFEKKESLDKRPIKIKKKERMSINEYVLNILEELYPEDFIDYLVKKKYFKEICNLAKNNNNKDYLKSEIKPYYENYNYNLSKNRKPVVEKVSQQQVVKKQNKSLQESVYEEEAEEIIKASKRPLEMYTNRNTYKQGLRLNKIDIKLLGAFMKAIETKKASAVVSWLLKEKAKEYNAPIEEIAKHGEYYWEIKKNHIHT